MRRFILGWTALALCAISALDACTTSGVLSDALSREAWRLVATLASVWIVVQWAFQPLDALRNELVDRKPSDHGPVAPDRPEELAPLVRTLNTLLQAQRDSVTQERRFLADAAHQLRTPVAVLRTQLQGIDAGEAIGEETLARMLRTVDRVTGLINQLLSMEKVRQLVRRAQWTAIDIELVARDVTLELAPLIARKRLDFSLESIPITLCSDAWLLGELIRNLLSNAIRHSPPAGTLGIVIRALQDEVELVVWDRAGGIDAEALGRLFEPFAASKGGTGIGLGLSICRRIADSMHATLSLANRVDDDAVIGVDAVVRWPRSLLGLAP